MRLPYYGLCCLSFIILLSACSSSKKYKMLESNRQNLQLQLDSSRSQLAQLIREKQANNSQQKAQIQEGLAAKKAAEEAQFLAQRQLEEAQKARKACEGQLAQTEKALQIFQAKLAEEAQEQAAFELAEKAILEQFKTYQGLGFERITRTKAIRIACPDSLLFEGKNSVQRKGKDFLEDLASLLNEKTDWELELRATADKGTKVKARLAQANTRANSVAIKLRLLKLSLERLDVGAWAKEDDIPLYLYIYPKGNP